MLESPSKNPGGLLSFEHVILSVTVMNCFFARTLHRMKKGDFALSHLCDSPATTAQPFTLSIL